MSYISFFKNQLFSAKTGGRMPILDKKHLKIPAKI